MIRMLVLDSGDDENEDINAVLSPKWTEQLIDKFQTWLTSVDGRLRNERCPGQRARRVLFILKMISPNEFNLRHLFDRVLLQEKWLNMHNKNVPWFFKKKFTILFYAINQIWC